MFKALIASLIILFFCLCKVSLPNIEESSSITKDSLAIREIGHLLFFDKNLSYDKSISCSTCHDPTLAFTDGYKLSVNSKAENLQRNSPTLLNINNRENFNWANPSIQTLIQQMQRPLYGTHPVELGIKGNEPDIFPRIKANMEYKRLYQLAFGKNIQNLKLQDIEVSLEHYIKTLQSRNSPFDKFLITKDSNYLNEEQWYGFYLFHSDSIDCSACHGGVDSFSPDRGGNFANIGLYNCNGKYPTKDSGIENESHDQDDNGLFRIPTLRNVAITGPYYHDGSEENLESIIKNYERSGRMIDYGDCKGDGANNPNIDGRLQKFNLQENERRALISFLHSLTDTSYLSNKMFRDPFSK
ncbi:MAG: hypothetical protein HOP11_06335 [Saprospiraceae bacterium]|nr:hypothetical protein [Saprospiraceae bacterium]